MRKQGKPFGVMFFTLFLAFWGFVLSSWAEQEIDLGDLNGPTPTPQPAAAPSPTPVPAQKAQPKAAPSPTPAGQEIEMDENSQAETQAAPQPTPTVYEVQGVLKMKDVYQAGINAYKDQDYDRAIRYLNKALDMDEDRYTPKFYYAEAHAMLGVIYQFHMINYAKAYAHYKAALKFEPENDTARHHINQVRKLLKGKD